MEKNKDDYKLVKFIAIGVLLLVIIPNLQIPKEQKESLQTLSFLAMGGFSIVDDRGGLYYGCTSPISEQDCIYYGNEYYKKNYTNVENIGCKDTDWGVECTFNGDKIQ